jgi:adenosylmethionine-8-amino-7-oxononanoate aminotransferase
MHIFHMATHKEPPLSRLIHLNLRETPPVAVRGEGPYLFDAAGKKYIDASGGPAVTCLGHGDPEVVAAIREQAGKVNYAFDAFFTHEPGETLAHVLTDAAPEPLKKVFFVSGGSEGVESALKFARQFHLERGELSRALFISRRQSYHGATLGALAVGGQTLRQEPFAPMLMDVARIAPCYPYREQAVGESAEDYGLRAADELEAAILAAGPENVAAFIAETVVGGALGAVAAAPGYFRRIRDICDRYGVLLILDEVLCGMGRTGSLFAFEQEGIVPDLCVVAKGLGGGYQPIGAVLVSEAIVKAVREGSGAFRHLFTFQAHPVACAAALAVQKAIRERDLLSNVRRQGERLMAALNDRLGDHPHVGDIRGRGLLMAVELVSDRESKEPFPSEAGLYAKIRAQGMAHGIVCYPGNGTVDGARGDHVLLAPPYIIEEIHVAEIADKMRATLDAALAQI